MVGGEGRSGERGEEREELSEEGGMVEAVDVRRAAARKAGLYKPRLAWIAEYLASSSGERGRE